jgi:inositol-phosphate phosphatase / L-galactose 1-phosphate phosphatase / histidinol-phosphatase
MIDWDRTIALAGRLADAAREEIRPRFQQKIATEKKADISPVTEADRAAETAIRALLAAERPDDAVIGEEYGQKAGTSGLTWVIDPIDGTKAFMTGRATFVTLIALLDGDRPVLGVIDQAITGDRWVGVAGRDTTHNGSPVRSRHVPELGDATFSTTDPNLFPGTDAEVYRRVSASAGMRTYGGDGLAYGLLSSGWVDIVLESGLKLHDFAALVPVVEGAGGIISDWAGKPVNAASDGRILVTGSAALHAKLLALM